MPLNQGLISQYQKGKAGLLKDWMAQFEPISYALPEDVLEGTPVTEEAIKEDILDPEHGAPGGPDIGDAGFASDLATFGNPYSGNPADYQAGLLSTFVDAAKAAGPVGLLSNMIGAATGRNQGGPKFLGGLLGGRQGKPAPVYDMVNWPPLVGVGSTPNIPQAPGFLNTPMVGSMWGTPFGSAPVAAPANPGPFGMGAYSGPGQDPYSDPALLGGIGY